MSELHSWAKLLGGEVSGGQVLCPGPRHTADDRSLAVKIGRDGEPIVHSFCPADNDLECKDFARKLLGMEPFKPKGNGKASSTKRHFDYPGPDGALLYQVEREDFPDGSKKIRQRRPDGKGGWAWNLGGVQPVPYRLPELIEAAGNGNLIVIAEGEAKVDLLWSWNIPATCNSGGAGKWRAQHSAYLRGADVIILPDNDESGRKHAGIVAASLRKVGATARVLDLPGLPEKGDVIDWAAAGGTVEKLHALIEDAEEKPPSNAQAKDEAKPLPVLRVLNPADWEGKKAPARRWDVPDYIPHGVPALLYADGGTGKGYLGLQLGVARAVAKEWIGLMPEPGRTLILSTEDDGDEMWRRIEGMLPFFGASMADLADMRLVDLVGESSVLGLLQKGIIEPTPMYEALDAYMTNFKPGMVILDVLADLFSGEESKREQVTQFMGLLKRLGRKHDCTPLLSAQPSLTGMNTGTGTSGSTGWHNSGRGRMYFQTVKTPDGAEPNKDLRTFEGMKNNYGVRGGKFDLEWKDGLFRRVAGPTGFDRMAREQKLDETFLTLLKRLSLQNRPVRATNSKSGAPSLFEAEPDNGGFKAKDFGDAMLRLLGNGKIANELETEGPPSKRINRLVIKEWD